MKAIRIPRLSFERGRFWGSAHWYWYSWAVGLRFNWMACISALDVSVYVGPFKLHLGCSFIPAVDLAEERREAEEEAI